MNSNFTQEQLDKLNSQLDPRRVAHRPGGGNTQLSYLEGHDVINMANEILGYGNWGYDLLAVELNNITDEKGEVVGSYYAARLRLTVAGCVPITEEGVCAVSEGRNPRAKIDAHDMSRKGAITDALKRAFRCYGEQFGNSLYGKGAGTQAPRPNQALVSRPAPAQAPVAKPVVQEAAPEVKIRAAFDKVNDRSGFEETYRKLTASFNKELVNSIGAKYAEKFPAPTVKSA